MLDSVKNFFFGSPEPYCGRHTDSFCYLSIKDRHPVTLTKVIDQVYRLGSHNAELSEDSKRIAASLSRLKNRLQTDKEVEELEGSAEDLNIWNKRLKSLNPKTWFSAPWLVVECYLYRYIHEVLQANPHFAYPKFDIFREEKNEGLTKSMGSMSQIGDLLQTLPSPTKPHIENFLKLSLWGNKTDLSLLKHFHLELSDVQDMTDADKNDSKILTDHLHRIIDFLDGLNNAQVDIVLDNAGYELFSDLCLAEVLLRTGKVKKVKFHMKAMPWFVSDVTDPDLKHMISELSDSSSDSLRALGSSWEGRLSDGTFTATDHAFWTSPYGFKDMAAVSRDLYDELARADVLIFKGDLNYRKLVNDRRWAYDTDFQTALEGFHPTNIVTLRTIKCDAIAGCADASRITSIMKEDRDSLFNGSYALISCNF